VILVIDASVAVKWFVDEERSELARDVFREGLELAAPDLLLVEVANAMRKKVRLGLMTLEQAQESLGILPNLFGQLRGPRDTLAEAFEFARTLNHPVADCMYLACARITDAILLTDDETLYLKAGGLSGKLAAMRLSDWAPAPATRPAG
jgi:predicted nucleic acid-binding protein